MSIRNIHRSLTGMDICLVRLDEFRPLADLPERVKGEIDGDANVSCDEPMDVEGTEGVKPVEQGDHAEEAEGEVGCVGLEVRPEDEGSAIDPLGLERGVESDVGDGDAHPGNQSGDCDDILEPLEDDLCAGCARHVGKKGDGCSDGDAKVRNTSIVAISANCTQSKYSNGEENTFWSISREIVAPVHSGLGRTSIAIQYIDVRWQKMRQM